MKQYLLMCDESCLQQLMSLFSTNIKFLEVQGMPMQGSGGHILVSPAQPSITPMIPQPQEDLSA